MPLTEMSNVSSHPGDLVLLRMKVVALGRWGTFFSFPKKKKSNKLEIHTEATEKLFRCKI